MADILEGVGVKRLATAIIELSRALMTAEELKGWCQTPHHRLVGLTPGQVAARGHEAELSALWTLLQAMRRGH